MERTCWHDLRMPSADKNRFCALLPASAVGGRNFLNNDRSEGMEAANIASPSSAAAHRRRGGSAPVRFIRQVQGIDVEVGLEQRERPGDIGLFRQINKKSCLHNGCSASTVSHFSSTTPGSWQVLRSTIFRDSWQERYRTFRSPSPANLERNFQGGNATMRPRVPEYPKTLFQYVWFSNERDNVPPTTREA